MHLIFEFYLILRTDPLLPSVGERGSVISGLSSFIWDHRWACELPNSGTRRRVYGILERHLPGWHR